MEDQIFRFPHIAQQIFEQLDDESLANCREADRDWQYFINYENFYKCKIQKLMLRYKKQSWSNRNMSPLHLAAATGQTQVVLDIIKEEGKIDKYFGIVNKDLGGKNQNLMRSPLHYAVGFFTEKRGGYLSVCKALVENLEDKNPGDWDGFTALHMAIGHGSYDILKLLIDNATIKNPADKTGMTPLHWAAREELSTFKLIFENAEDKNPAEFTFKQTPLHYAAQWGALEVCKFILDNVKDKSTRLINLMYGPMPTPLHIAKMHGKRTIVEFFQEKARGVMMTSVTSRKDESDIIQANKCRRRY